MKMTKLETDETPWDSMPIGADFEHVVDGRPCSCLPIQRVIRDHGPSSPTPEDRPS